MRFEATKNVDKGMGEWIVTVDGQEWTDVISKAKNLAKNNIQIPGFRKGKIPANLVDKYLTESSILQQAHRLIVKKAYDYALEQKSDIQPFNSPVPNVRKLSMKEYILALDFDLRPSIAVKKYTDFTNIKKNSLVATEEQISQSIKSYQQKFAVYQPKTEPIAEGDVVNFDFDGMIDGESFPGGKAKNYNLEIGSNTFIPGFEHSMIGLKAGQDASINVRFPDDYQAENLKGKDAVFKLKIHEIKRKIVPDVDAELIKDLNLKDINTVDEFKNYVKHNIELELKKQEQERFIDELFRAIAKDSQIEIPESIIYKEVKKLKLEFEKKVKEQKMDLKTYKRKTGMNDKLIEDALFEDAKNRIENGIISDFIMHKETFSVDDKEIDLEYEKLAKQYGVDSKVLKDGLVDKEYIKSNIINEKLFDFLYENNGSATTSDQKVSSKQKSKFESKPKLEKTNK